MNSCKQSKIILKDGIFLQEQYEFSGSAIRAEPTGEDNSIDIEGVIFEGLGDEEYTKGGAIYVDMKEYNVELSLRRCIFINNKAEYGSNIFIIYSTPLLRIDRNSFISCTAIVSNSHEQDISICYSVSDKDEEIFIDERDLLHSSWQRQKSEDVVRFISNSDDEHQFDSTIECGSLANPCDSFTSLTHYLEQEPDSIIETIIFCTGTFLSPYIDLSLTRSNTINIVGCGIEQTEIIPQQNEQNILIEGKDGQNLIIERLSLKLSSESPLVGFVNIQGLESGLVLQEVKIEGYSDSTPSNTVLEPEYLFKVEGFALFKDAIIEHVYLKTGAILQVDGLKRQMNIEQMEWLGRLQPGFYSCLFNDITSNENGAAVIDTIEKYGLIYIEKLNRGNKKESSSGQVEIEDVFIAGSHSPIGSAFSIIGVDVEITESTFIEPQSSGNMIYLSQTETTIEDVFLKGYNGTYKDPAVINENDQKQDDQDLFTSPNYALLFAGDGEYDLENVEFEETGIDAIQVSNSDVVLNNTQFNNPSSEDDEESSLMLKCNGNSKLQIIDPKINGKTEEECNSVQNGDEGCKFEIDYGARCQLDISDNWEYPKLIPPSVSKAKVIVNISKVDIEESLRFTLDGQDMIQGYLTVKIVELEDIVQDEYLESQSIQDCPFLSIDDPRAGLEGFPTYCIENQLTQDCLCAVGSQTYEQSKCEKDILCDRNIISQTLEECPFLNTDDPRAGQEGFPSYCTSQSELTDNCICDTSSKSYPLQECQKKFICKYDLINQNNLTCPCVDNDPRNEIICEKKDSTDKQDGKDGDQDDQLEQPIKYSFPIWAIVIIVKKEEEEEEE
ncbi:MAG: hypothetical protein EZS28_023217 [Streblomastix strix]|uniref:Uncharacterized protein n=1 Tax=Streblomastix strix TaxID=222440 RepID=A0A5J4VFY1_9EUKA|nr:MAG: hypothetical protein EZS28_023217 [Streblomastix strix]